MATSKKTPKKKKTAARRKSAPALKALPTVALRWRCDPESFDFDSTAEITPARGVDGVVGQDAAIEALKYGLETQAPGQNIFVRGLHGTGRLTLLTGLLQESGLDATMSKDFCFVHNFQQPDRPCFIELPPGQGRSFKHSVDHLAQFIRHNLKEALNSEGVRARRAALESAAKSKVSKIVHPFEEDLHQHGLRLVSYQAGPITQTAIFPTHEDQPVPPEEYEQLFRDGKITEEQLNSFREHIDEYEKGLAELNAQVGEIRNQHAQAVQGLLEKSARFILNELVHEIQTQFPQEAVNKFLQDLVDEVVKHLGAEEGENGETADITRLYQVNVVLERTNGGSRPTIAENAPSVRNLLGTIECEYGPGDEIHATHMGIRAGSLMRADGGFLILEARDLISEPGAWKMLLRTLRTGKMEIAAPEALFHRAGPSLKPEAVPLNVKVILLGDSETHYLLDTYEPEFPLLFKVLADFDSVIPRNRKNIDQYAGVLARITQDEQLLPLDRSGVAALVEQGARIAARAEKLTTRFGRVADIAREASFIAAKDGKPRVAKAHVRQAILKGKRRADLPARRFRELVAKGIIRVETQGRMVGQINGLAVLSAGPLTYGFPARITATIGPGTLGAINIEREAALSGAIHTKGFYILSGLLRNLLRTDHPLTFEASVAFEQSYGGIDGDSASGAEICCLLSALTDIPLRQDLAVTGAIDQMGHILAIGAVNEKIEGFFDACQDAGFTGTQGVIVPKANAGDLMLREDVVDACAAGKFRIYAVETVHETLEVLTGIPAGVRSRTGAYPRRSLLGIAVERARDFWLRATQGPVSLRK